MINEQLAEQILNELCDDPDNWQSVLSYETYWKNIKEIVIELAYIFHVTPYMAADAILNTDIREEAISAIEEICSYGDYENDIPDDDMLSEYIAEQLEEIFINDPKWSNRMLENKKSNKSNDQALLESIAKVTGIRSKAFNKKVLNIVKKGRK